MGDNKAFCNSDGDFLIMPQLNTLIIRTEMGILSVEPWEFCVIPRGIKFSVDLKDENIAARGYICEIFTHAHFELPNLGPIGANGLADARHFAYPKASYINKKDIPCYVVQKFMGKLFQAKHKSNVFDVVAYQGNYLPYKYNCKKYIAINSVTIDHLDPSIFTVLTCPTHEVGVAVCDFVIFPPRYCVQENTFRPPYYHKNCMSEFMGNICGQYEAKPDGFQPGGGSLHSIMTGHGPDSNTYEKASNADTSKPIKLPDDSLAFMFESNYLLKVTNYALDNNLVQSDYAQCWTNLKHNFDPNKK